MTVMLMARSIKSANGSCSLTRWVPSDPSYTLGYPFATNFGLPETERGTRTQDKPVHPAVPHLDIMQSAGELQTRGPVPAAVVAIGAQDANDLHTYPRVPEVAGSGVGVHQVLVAGSQDGPAAQALRAGADSFEGAGDVDLANLGGQDGRLESDGRAVAGVGEVQGGVVDRKSTRLNSS